MAVLVEPVRLVVLGELVELLVLLTCRGWRGGGAGTPCT